MCCFIPFRTNIASISGELQSFWYQFARKTELFPHCGRVIKHDDKIVGGPEYEPLSAYGGDCGNDDLYTIDEPLKRLGLDECVGK